MVITIDRGRYTCLVDDHEVTAAKARQLGRKGVIVGDRARLVGDVSGDEGTLARVVEVLDRQTVLRRTADDDDPYERPIVANADQLVIVTALADPQPRTGMIDRCLVAGYDAGLDPLLCLTKADLASPDELIAMYGPLDVPIEITSPGADLDSLRERLAGRRSVFVGHSGVGKSTLVNALIPDANRSTGSVNEVTGKGRHTSTAAYALQLPPIDPSTSSGPSSAEPGEGPGWVIDTPGVRSFGLSHVSRDRIVAAFDDLERFVADCPRGCPHDTGAEDCGLDAAVERGDLSAARLESFRRMITTDQ
ncbi:ribosome small subunit-dependent GTPase A [Microlunatus elymi]|uniref:Ribosome small subunit-dependent GTPase A n=2 Tax=Microlunatus elymi TaxID=2596828 RepID=A0A516Q5V4_9ACTN|nr:ribosome small subunit-dependent GTPase A [Microlunatus elymi]